jgi:hypothetical protein
MSLVSRVGQVLRSLAQDYRGRRERRRFLRTYRAEREAKIARGEAPPSFRSYDDYLRSEWWRRLRGHVLDHLSYECEFCAGRATQVHHVRYPRTTDLGSEGIKSLYAVCSRCHDIAHGLSANNTDSECAFCRAKATVTLAIAIAKYGRSTQRTCRRCDSLANGYRGQANRWAKKDYETWVERWRQTMPSLYDAPISPHLAQHPVEDDRRDQSDKAVRAAAARRLVLEEREREFAALSTEELRSQWESREQSDYEEDELHLLRSVIRQRLGYQR